MISTVNIQHLESMNDVVEQITGIEQRETIPDAVVRAADQVELVDMTPEALRRRMAHGNIYPPEKVDASLANYFREGNLGALRELALMWVADRVDEALEDYREAHGIPGRGRRASGSSSRSPAHPVATTSSGGPPAWRCARAASCSGCTCGRPTACAVRRASRWPSSARLLQELGGEYHEMASADVADALVQFARAENATQLVLGASRQSRWTPVRARLGDQRRHPRVGPDRRPRDLVGGRRHAGARRADRRECTGRRPRRRGAAVSPRRRLLAWVLAVVLPPLLTLVLANVRDTLTLPSDLLIFLLVVVVVAASAGSSPAVVCAISGFLLANWYFTPPFHTFTISEGENLLALVIFLLVGGVVSVLVAAASRRTAEAAQARAEAETLAALGGTVAASDDPLPQLVAQLRRRSRPTASPCSTGSADGAPGRCSRAPATPSRSIPTTPTWCSRCTAPRCSRLSGGHLGDDDREVLRSFAGQVALAVERRELRADAERAIGLAEANELRTALLAAVSHDLRTPLSSIKASVSSLLQRDVDLTPSATRELLETIDEDADRLNHLVGNLLDMSRLQTGALQLVMRDVGLDEVLPVALAGLTQADRVDVDVAETLPRVHADAALLERAIANVVENAIAWSPPDAHVRVEACVAQDRVDLRVVDRGPGIPPAEREDVFRPFQRLGDRSNGSGVGLGLAVARGFVEAMGGEIVVDDTPGGGVTMVISMPAASP